MDMGNIKRIVAVEIFADSKSEYSIGVDGVTQIKREEYSPAPYCHKYLFHIWKSEKLFCAYKILITIARAKSLAGINTTAEKMKLAQQ